MEAKKGICCSPLRLLAMEVFDKVNALGVYCALHTGQEKNLSLFQTILPVLWKWCRQMTCTMWLFFEVKMAIEKHTNHHCCVIYGALPPETRRQQATPYNDQDNEFDVLVVGDLCSTGAFRDSGAGVGAGAGLGNF